MISPEKEPSPGFDPSIFSYKKHGRLEIFFFCMSSFIGKHGVSGGGGRVWGVGCLLYAALKGQCHEIFFGRKYSTWVTSEQA